MYISSPIIAYTYRIVYISICAIGLLMHINLFDFNENIRMFSFFTIQMNLVCFITYIILARETALELKHPRSACLHRNRFPNLRGMVMLGIIIVFLAYNFVLRNTGFSMLRDCPTTITTNDIFVHYLVPGMTFLDWILFQPKGNFMLIDPFIWLILPIGYYCIINIKTIFTSAGYPYYFINIDELGLNTVINNAFLFMIICLIVGYLIVITDRILKHFSNT
ncbi:MAG: hypothetical protein E7270_05020 [Lachnospiraceae bacterium]|nr:hypothetical protein [Lachnospiraceae bacterium]